MRIEPGFRVLLYLHASAFEASPPGLSCGLLWKIIVELEAAIEAGRETLAVQDHGANERRGMVTALRK